MTQNLENGRKLHSFSFLLALQTTHEQVYHSACLLAPSPQLAKLVVFIIKLRVHIAFFEFKQWHTIFFASTFSLMFFEIISFWDKTFRPLIAMQLWQTILVKSPLASNSPSAHINRQDQTSCQRLVTVFGAVFFLFGTAVAFPSVAFVFLAALPPSLETSDSRSCRSSDPTIDFEVGQ
jgi:hypothetical protein